MRRAALISISALVLCAGPALGIMIEIPFETIVSQSEIIIRGRVVDRVSFWSDDGRTIYTDVTIATTETLKGKLDGHQTTVRVEGGEVGNVGIHVEHQPTFRIDENVIIFMASTTADGTRFIPHLEQGKFTVIGPAIVGHSGRAESLKAFTKNIARLVSTQED